MTSTMTNTASPRPSGRMLKSGPKRRESLAGSAPAPSGGRPLGQLPLLVLLVASLRAAGPIWWPQLGAAAPAARSGPIAGNSDAGQANATESAPDWQRPGCHRMGHTRAISIPGCVKFNLYSHACRGYCMSFSIPADEDIGPAPILSVDQLDGLLSGDASHGQRWATRAPPSAASEAAAAAAEAEAEAEARPTSNGAQPARSGPLAGRKSGRADFVQPSLSWDALEHYRGARAVGAASRLVGGPSEAARSSPLAGAIGDTSIKRDVVSVSQCCNMMETEDIIVNLRCGLNETRRLVFKSAKTCECFFCKHF